MIDERTFQIKVERAFRTLMASLNYYQTRSDGYIARYENDLFFFEVRYDANRTNELTFWFGRLGSSDLPLEIADILQFAKCDESIVIAVGQIQTDKADILEHKLNATANYMRQYCTGTLSGGEEEYEKVYRDMGVRSQEYTDRLSIQPILDTAEIAWVQKEYDRVHDLLNPIKDHLDNRLKRRLRYAEKKLS